MNRIAERDGLEIQTHHLLFEERGIDQEPTQHHGPTADKIEREGKRSDRGDVNRQIKAAYDNQDALKKQANVIYLDAMRNRDPYRLGAMVRAHDRNNIDEITELKVTKPARLKTGGA